jgi:hypothetical protein
MGVSFRELREKCQQPVRAHNDVAGLLFGDQASLPLTKLWVDLRLSPDIATVGTLVAGVVGAGLQLLPSLWVLVGALLFLLYYVLDCVDGEVARYQKVENIKWGYYEYIFHMLVKPLCFLGIGFGLHLELGQPLFILAGAIAAVSTLWLKLFVEVPGIMFVHGVITAPRGKDRAFRRYAEERDLFGGGAPSATSDESGPVGFPLGFNMVTLRALATNFDIGLILLVAATAVDLAVDPIALPLLGPTTLRGVWMAYYGVILPLDFLDYLRTYFVSGHFPREMARMLTLAHHFEVPSAGLGQGDVEGGEGEPGESG